MTRSPTWLAVLLSCLALGACKGAALGGGRDAGPDATAAEPPAGGNLGSDAGPDATAADSGQQTLDIDAEEVAVYVALLGNTTGMQVIADQTETGISGVSGTSQTVDRVIKQMPDVAPATTASFLARNATVHQLRADMSLGVPYVLISQAETNAIFWGDGGQDGWQAFRALYPDAHGIQSLSRVGFNTDLTQALVYLGSQGDWLAGEGNYYLMKKVNGVWTIEQTVMIWIS